MTFTTLSSGEFKEDPSRAMKAAQDSPVFVAEQGRPCHVLMTFEDYQRLVANPADIVTMLALPGMEDIEFDPPRVEGIFRPA